MTYTKQITAISSIFGACAWIAVRGFQGVLRSDTGTNAFFLYLKSEFYPDVLSGGGSENTEIPKAHFPEQKDFRGTIRWPLRTKVKVFDGISRRNTSIASRFFRCALTGLRFDKLTFQDRHPSDNPSVLDVIDKPSKRGGCKRASPVC